MEPSTSRLPSYTPPSKDAISRIPSLSALHPDPTHPAHKALKDFDLKKDSVKIFSFSQGGIIVCPEEVGSSEAGEEETWAKAAGYLQVVSTQRKTVSQISVKVVARQSLSFPQDRGAKEEDELVVREAVLKDVLLEKGVNTFEFLLSIPHSTSTYQETPSMMISHLAVGTVVGGTKGRMYGLKDLVDEEVVWFEAAPAGSSNPDALSWNTQIQGLSAQLGPFALHASSSRLLIGGPFSLSFALHSPPPDLQVYAIKCFIEQNATITSIRFPTKSATIPSKAMVLEEGWAGPYGPQSFAQLLKEGRSGKEMMFDASLGVEGEGGGTRSWTFENVVRMPIHDKLRATTHPNTVSSVRIASDLVVELFFAPKNSPDSTMVGKLLIATICRIPISLAGCTCLSGRLSLPNYTQDPEKWIPVTLTIPCQCDEPAEPILEAERAWLKSSRAAAAALDASSSSLSSTGVQLASDASASIGRKAGEDY